MSTTEVEDYEAERARIASTEKAMTEAGVATTERIYDDYFGFAVPHRVMLPDGRQWIEHTELNEGAKKAFQNSTNRDIEIQKATGNARMRTAMGDERHGLLKVAITDWHLMKHGEPVPFSKKNLADFLEVAPPRVVELIEKNVRKANPWLLAEMSVEDIDHEISNLEEMKAKVIEEQAGKLTSSSK